MIPAVLHSDCSIRTIKFPDDDTDRNMQKPGLGNRRNSPASLGFRRKEKYAAIVCAHPTSSCKGLVICGGGGHAANAAMTERRFKALATVATAHYGRVMHEGNSAADAAIRPLKVVAQQRTAQARGAEASATYPTRSKSGWPSACTHIEEVVDCYKTPSGTKSRFPESAAIRPSR